MRKSYLVEYADDMLKDESRAEKIKKTRQRKRQEEAIAVALLQGRPKYAIALAEKYNIPPQDFAKLVLKYTGLGRII